MSVIEWPAGLPYHSEASAGDMRPSRPQPETEMEGGNVRLRDRPGDRLRTVPWSRRLLPEQYALWSEFLSTTLACGTRRFVVPVWTGTGEGDGYGLRLVQIVGGSGGVSEVPTGRGLHMRVSFSLLVFPPELGPPPPAFDAFASQLYAAFGLSRLRSSYSGPGLRVRRSNDGTEADIGFTFLGALDVAGLLAFAGTASAFVVAWYDQSGNGRHATQSVTASQPRLVSAGALDTGTNGGPALVFSGTQSFGIAGAAGLARNASNLTIGTAGISSATAPSSIFFSASRGANLSWYRVALLHTPTLASARLSASANDVDNPPIASRAYTTGAWSRFIGRARFLDGEIDCAINGATTIAALGTSTASVDSDSVVKIGIGPNGGAPLAGQMSALVLSRSALDIAALDAALQGTLP